MLDLFPSLLLPEEAVTAHFVQRIISSRSYQENAIIEAVFLIVLGLILMLRTRDVCNRY